ncbi:MAG: hypothetical protein QOI57_2729 [Rubrobacteraceae bacterium]|nr:hypothetical protein [Rubrobacteraceae bacterium]
MAALYCSCEQEHPIWGEFWWSGGKYAWVFFDGAKSSEIYTEQITHCPGCGQRLERVNLDAVKV